MAAEKTSPVFEEFFQNIRKAAETNMKMQQEVFQQWTTLWPGVPTPQTAWANKLKDFQKQWTSTVSDMARRHREVVDQQYQSAIESLDSALRVTESSNPEEYRRRSEQLCRKTIDCMREMSESQIREVQNAVSKCTELMTKTTK